ncbi:MAG TPA: hypothetical protein VF173_30010 [Thermoanaerobaculia bacterium]|nr:hypothetical protein [Thermoanaerobaculia bacterium]
MKTPAFAAAVLLLAAPSGAWNLVGCPPEVVQSWASQEAALRAAKPGGPLYLPRPFPKSKAEIMEDYLYELPLLLKETPAGSLPKEAAAVREGVHKQTLRYEILRIVNWSPTRCEKERRLDAYHLIRVFDGKSGREITRSVLDESGRLQVISVTLEDERAVHLRPEAEELHGAESRFKLRGEDPQYVTTFGTLRCSKTSPCLAFRAAGRAHVVSNEGDLFEIDPQGRHLEMGKDVGTPELNAPVLKSLGPEGRLVSLGGKVFTAARRVGRRTSKAPAPAPPSAASP